MRSMTLAFLGCLITSGTWAGAVPKEVIGTWSDQQTCQKGSRKMVFAATSATVIQDDGRRKSVQVDATGTAAERLEVRVTKVLSGEKADPAGAHAGDILLIRMEEGNLHLIGQGDATGVHEENGPILYRCKS